MTDEAESQTIEEARAKYMQAEADLKKAKLEKNAEIRKKMEQEALRARKIAGAEINIFKALDNEQYPTEIIKGHQKALEASQRKLAAARKKYSEIDRKRKVIDAIIDSGNHIHWSQLNQCQEYMDEKHPKDAKLTKEELEAVKAECDAWRAKNPGKTMKDYRDYLLKQRKEQGNIIRRERDVNIPNAKRNIQMAKDTMAVVEEIKAQKAAAEAAHREEEAMGGSGGSGGNDGEDNGNETIQKPYKDQNGNVVATATYDKNGKMVDCTFRDNNGNEQKLKAKEIQKANINIDDIKDALEKGDLAKALEMLLTALTAKNNNYQAQQTTTKEYRDGDAVFTVEKSGDKITSITLKEGDGQPTKITEQMFSKAGIDPKVVEADLENKDFQNAGARINQAAIENGIQIITQEPQIALKGNNIILTDQCGRTFELNEAYLQAAGMKKAQAKGTIENLQKAMAVRPTPKGLDQAVAAYFSSNNPAPYMPKPKESSWSVKSLNRNLLKQGMGMAGVTSNANSITVINSNGTTKKIKASDIAEYYHCDKKDGRKILKAYARAIENGADLNEILGNIAEKTADNAKTKTKSKSNVGKVLAGTALGIGGVVIANHTEGETNAILNKIMDGARGI